MLTGRTLYQTVGRDYGSPDSFFMPRWGHLIARLLLGRNGGSFAGTSARKGSRFPQSRFCEPFLLSPTRKTFRTLRKNFLCLLNLRKFSLRDRTVFLVGVNKHGSPMRDKQELAPLANRSAGATKLTRDQLLINTTRNATTNPRYGFGPGSEVT
jgi:hypothetical protein